MYAGVESLVINSGFPMSSAWVSKVKYLGFQSKESGFTMYSAWVSKVKYLGLQWQVLVFPMTRIRVSDGNYLGVRFQVSSLLNVMFRRIDWEVDGCLRDTELVEK